MNLLQVFSLLGWICVASLSRAQNDALSLEFQERIRRKNGMSDAQLQKYLPNIHPRVTEPIAEGVSLAVPKELGNRQFAELGIVDVTAAQFGADARYDDSSDGAACAVVSRF